MNAIFVPGGTGPTGANEVPTPRSPTNPTSERLGYNPKGLDEDPGLLVPWLHSLRKIS